MNGISTGRSLNRWEGFSRTSNGSTRIRLKARRDRQLRKYEPMLPTFVIIVGVAAWLMFSAYLIRRVP
jgi:hypothetical protein